MTAMTTVAPDTSPKLPWGRPLTRADLDAMPDDGHRRELVDGVLVVSPAPRTIHQFALARLYLLVEANRPEDHLVLFAPVDVVLADDTVLQPDLLVAPTAEFTDRGLLGAPLLALEVLSPSTRGFDLLLKKDRLERAGCQHYWVFDPQVPAITTWRLQDEHSVDSGTATGTEPLVVSDPFELTLVPADLVPPRAE